MIRQRYSSAWPATSTPAPAHPAPAAQAGASGRRPAARCYQLNRRKCSATGCRSPGWRRPRKRQPQRCGRRQHQAQEAQHRAAGSDRHAVSRHVADAQARLALHAAGSGQADRARCAAPGGLTGAVGADQVTISPGRRLSSARPGTSQPAEIRLTPSRADRAHRSCRPWQPARQNDRYRFIWLSPQRNRRRQRRRLWRTADGRRLQLDDAAWRTLPARTGPGTVLRCSPVPADEGDEQRAVRCARPFSRRDPAPGRQ